ncbi:uncharacterized protein EI90DRAFT_3150264 [Cantharellus anzutake]|uniref:uncharacterized protein n=1 Tax=Cantharellus anzutake TaxID=1750568 RepID=UPI0019076884|nr:uncharacterized protein EI90DRAFT_3150264 [Cantharellus anzutake]KAF8342179.1 hypothetical protein EI90DRAFT_3150264 [Cantharellus anzutake]
MRPLRRLDVLPAFLLSLIYSWIANGEFIRPRPNPLKQVLEHTPVNQPSETCAKLRLKGPIETTHCDYETVESVNDELVSNLSALVRKPFFRYYKVDLYRECPFWRENGFCMHRTCGVTSIDESQVPREWRAEALSQVRGAQEGIVRLPGCFYKNSDFCFLDDNEGGEYVDLTENPEGFTGYAGASAHRIWGSIYNENCFGLSEATLLQRAEMSRFDRSPASILGLSRLPATADEGCLEKRVYYRIISGMHASISIHICHRWFNQTTGVWGPNLQCFANRIALHPERLQHLYFNNVLLLRAVSRVGPYLSAYSLDDEEKGADELLDNVLNIAKSAGAFDETALFRGNDAKILKEEFKDHFRNVSLIMDCVGCDKCRLWGKIQVTGIAAALKILFEMDENALDPQLNRNLLTRWEVVALINTLRLFSESLKITEDFRALWHETHDAERIISEAETEALITAKVRTSWGAHVLLVLIPIGRQAKPQLFLGRHRHL